MTIKTEEVKLICFDCEEELNEYELENPYHNSSGDVLCDNCYREECEFLCTVCGNYENDPDESIRDAALVVWDADGAGVPAGFYQITQWPYYADGMIEAHLYESALRFIGPLPTDLEADDYYPCGKLCRDCQIKYGIPPGYRLFDPIFLGC